MKFDYYLEQQWSLHYDCWAMVRDFYRREFDIGIPVVLVDALDRRAVLAAFKSHPVRQEFCQIDDPVNGCVVEMGSFGRPFHVGIYWEGSILHNHFLGGVVLEPKPPFDILGYYATRTIATEPA